MKTVQQMSKDIKAHNTILKGIKARFTKVTVDFNEAVINSVKLLWEHGDISVINNTMDTLKCMKGADMRALATYYRACIPFTFDGNSEKFTRKNPKTVEKMENMWAEYIETTMWYDLSQVKEAKPYKFDYAQIIKYVQKQLEKGQEAGQLTLMDMEALAHGLDKAINAQLTASLDDLPEGDIKIDEKELAELLREVA